MAVLLLSHGGANFREKSHGTTADHHSQIIQEKYDKGAECSRPSWCSDVNEFSRASPKVKISDLLEVAACGDTKKISPWVRIDPGLVNACDYDRRSALHLACAEGHQRTVELLLRNGAKICCRDRWVAEPLQEAILHGHKGIVQLLLQAGAAV